MAQHAPNAPLNPAALPVEDAARLLSAAGGGGGGGVTADMLRADIEAGAPTNADGSINLVHYTAWLVRAIAEMNQGGGVIGGD